MANKNPAVTVIVPMFNAENFIEPCLNSLLNQSFNDFEVIVADDCSTDQSPAIVKSFVEKFDGRLRLIKTKKNSGTASAPRNLALKSARSEYITYLDADDLLTKTAVEELLTAAETFDA